MKFELYCQITDLIKAKLFLQYAQNLKEARTVYLSLKAIDDTFGTKILLNNRFLDEQTSERICDTRDVSRMSSANYLFYCELWSIEIKKIGFARSFEFHKSLWGQEAVYTAAKNIFLDAICIALNIEGLDKEVFKIIHGETVVDMLLSA